MIPEFQHTYRQRRTNFEKLSFAYRYEKTTRSIKILSNIQVLVWSLKANSLKWMYPVWSSENNRLSSFHVFSRAVIKWLFDISFCTKKAPLTSTQNMILTFYLEYDLMSRYTISPRLFFQWMQDTISSWIINITSFACINIFLQFSSYIFHTF